MTERIGSDPDPRRKILQSARIEGIVFEKDKIKNLIGKIAERHGLRKEDLFQTEEVFDNKGNLLSLAMEVRREKAAALGYFHISYTYSIKGTYGVSEDVDVPEEIKSKVPGPGSDSTNIYVSLEKGGMVSAGMAAEFTEGEWRIVPYSEIAARKDKLDE